MCTAIAVFASQDVIDAYMRGEEIDPELPDMPKEFTEYQERLRKERDAKEDKKQLFKTYKKYKNGGHIEIINGYKKKSDHKDLIAIARDFAQKGDNVKITTNIHFKDEKYKEVFGSLIGAKYERKCPDLIINDKFYEYEKYVPPFSKNKVSNMLKKGLQQSPQIIINNNKGASDRYIKKLVYNRLNKGQTINEVWLYERGETRLLYKKQ